MEDKEVKIQAYSKKQLADLYKISLLTLNSWLKPFENEIGCYRGKCYTPKQINTIFKYIGNP